MYLAVFAVGALVLSLLSVGSAPVPDGSRVGAFDLAQARSFTEFPLYDAGDRVDGLPLTTVLRRDDAADFVSFVYGDCTAQDDQGCAPPLEIQVWPACKRNLALYDSSAPGAPAPEHVMVRGMPAAFFEDGDRLELETGRSTVVIFAGSRSENLLVAAALRALGKHATCAQLPAPEAGAVAGTVRC